MSPRLSPSCRGPRQRQDLITLATGGANLGEDRAGAYCQTPRRLPGTDWIDDIYLRRLGLMFLNDAKSRTPPTA